MSCHLTIILHFVKNLIKCNFLNKGGLSKLQCFGSIESISTPHFGHITDCFKQLLYMAIIVPQTKFYLHSRVLHYYPILPSQQSSWLLPHSPSLMSHPHTHSQIPHHSTFFQTIPVTLLILYYNCLCQKSIIIHDFLQYLLQTLCHFIFDAPSENISLYHYQKYLHYQF